MDRCVMGFVAVAVLLLAGCFPPFELQPAEAPSGWVHPARPVAADRVQVSPQQVLFSGRSTLSEGTCLRTELLAGDKPVSWWPVNTCVLVKNGQWQITVPLDQHQALDPTVDYRLHVRQAGSTVVEAVLAFDLGAPPAPQSEPDDGPDAAP